MRELIKKQPVFAVTTDLDWASEYCIKTLLSEFKKHKIKPTVFVTHQSDFIKKAKKNNEIELAIHPNFLSGSSHGDNPESVVSYVLDIVPDAIGSRSHAYASSTHITNTLIEKNIKYDSSPLLLFQQNLVPLAHGKGLIYFPVFGRMMRTGIAVSIGIFQNIKSIF